MLEVPTSVPDSMSRDLAKSGLTKDDIYARECTQSEMSAIGLDPSSMGSDGYIIPYYSITGAPLKYYRVKLLGQTAELAGMKYKQPPTTQNHVYFPPQFGEVTYEMHRQWRGRHSSLERPCVLIVEGEKKAAAACKIGIPTVAIGGIYSWKNRTVILPQGTTFKTIGVNTHARLPAGGKADRASIGIDEGGPAAIGLSDVISLCVTNDWDIIIAFDTDGWSVKPDVQRAAARLGYELRHRGARTPRIRQLVLPGKGRGIKVGVDDFIVDNGGASFKDLVNKTLKKGLAFPKHPTPREFVGSQLKGRMTRKDRQNTALAILTELESRGRRLRTIGSGDLHFFDNKTHRLMRVILSSQKDPLHETAFGELLYREFGVGGDDSRLLNWLASQYTGEPGVEDVKTRKVLTHLADHGMKDSIAIQISDSQFAIVSPDSNAPLTICHNGTSGVLFEQGQVEPVDPMQLEAEFYRYLDTPMEEQKHWFDVMAEMDFKDPGFFDGKTRPKANARQSQDLAALLYYISPYLMRWRGTQLPVELVVGEPGSGKSSLCSLRQYILSGRTSLINTTEDLKDWYATIASQGGMIILDNVNFINEGRNYAQRMSDEICRLVTEPDPHVEMRKLYSTHGLARIPAYTTFVLTAIYQPFVKPDLIQRAAIFELQKLRDTHESDWAARQLERCGGRIGWLGHQLAVLHRFLNKVVMQNGWSNNYKAEHRLTNYEQALKVTASLFGMETKWIPEALEILDTKEGEEDDLAGMQEEESASTLMALTEFAEWVREKYPSNYAGLRWTVADITRWARGHRKYCAHPMMSNPRRLGRYIQGNYGIVRERVRMVSRGNVNNRRAYVIYPKDGPIPSG